MWKKSWILLVCILVTGCGSQHAENQQGESQSAIQSDNDSQANEKKQQNAPNDSENMPEPDCSGTTAENQHTDNPHSGEASALSVDLGYYITDKKVLAKKLKNYPDSYSSAADALKEGVLFLSRRNTKKEQRQIDKIWEAFASQAAMCQKNPTGYQQAVLILEYTIEGDPIYSYVLNDDGRLYVYQDFSRDRFGGGESEIRADAIQVTEAKKDSSLPGGHPAGTCYQIGKDEHCFLYITENKKEHFSRDGKQNHAKLEYPIRYSSTSLAA